MPDDSAIIVSLLVAGRTVRSAGPVPEPDPGKWSSCLGCRLVWGGLFMFVAVEAAIACRMLGW